MGFTNSEQLRELFLSGGMGFLLGAYYDIFRIARRLLHTGKWMTFFQDCVFFVTSAVAVFLFSLALTDGEVRAYTLFGVVVGFAAYRYTVGTALLRLVTWAISLWKRVTGWLGRVISVPLRWLWRLLCTPFGKLWEKCQKVTKKSANFLKKGLQPIRKVLYNHNV